MAADDGHFRPELCAPGELCNQADVGSQSAETPCPTGYFCVGGQKYQCYAGYICIEGAPLQHQLMVLLENTVQPEVIVMQVPLKLLMLMVVLHILE